MFSQAETPELKQFCFSSGVLGALSSWAIAKQEFERFTYSSICPVKRDHSPGGIRALQGLLGGAAVKPSI